jgi:SAM-dependent methyltransferase
MNDFLNKKNLINAAKDHWKPPVYRNNTNRPIDRLKEVLYSFFDLQYSTIHRDLSKHLPHVTGDVLDVGCGIQPYRKLFTSKVNYRGIDIKESNSQFGYQTPDTIYYSGKIWPIKDQTVDFILSTETIEHVDDPARFLKEAFRVLRPGGQILMTVPFAARWHFIPYDYWRYTPSSLDLLLENAGFTDNRIYARGNQLTVACYKMIGFIFSLLIPLKSNFIIETIYRVTGIICLPIFFFLAVLANLTIRKQGTVDFLGFTILAHRPKTKSSKRTARAKN